MLTAAEVPIRRTGWDAYLRAPDEPLTAEQAADLAEELGGKLFRASRWDPLSTPEDHAFCHVCWVRIDESSGSVYVTADHEVSWVCAVCFAQCREQMGWHLVATQ